MQRGNPQQKRSQKRLARVMDAAKLELAEKGYSAFSIASVCDRAEVKSTSIYRYLPNKVSFLPHLMNEFADTISQQMNVRVQEDHDIKKFLDYLLRDLQTYSAQDHWILQAQIGMRAEISMAEQHEAFFDRMGAQMADALARYCDFDDALQKNRVGQSLVRVFDCFLMAYGRAEFLNRSNDDALRDNFVEVALSYLQHHGMLKSHTPPNLSSD